MLERVLRHINNWFVVQSHSGHYIVEGGNIAPPFVKNGQYFRVIGSTFNDGLHLYPAVDMKSEEFDGTVQALNIPKDLIDLCFEIEAWNEKYGESAASPYQSESFGGYSYSKSSGNGSDGGAVGWEKAFKSRLDSYRKIGGI